MEYIKYVNTIYNPARVAVDWSQFIRTGLGMRVSIVAQRANSRRDRKLIAGNGGR